MTPQHWQACFDVQTKSCVCPIENKDARVREAAPEMREMLLKLEWTGEAFGDAGCCAVCFATQHGFAGDPRPGAGQHATGCALAALLERIR